MRRKIFKNVVLLLVAIVCLNFCGCGRNKILYIEYDDSIRDFSAYTMDEECVSLNKEGRCVYFYLSDTCGACIDMLDLYAQLVSINFGETVDFYCLWEDEIPVNKIEKLNLDSNMILSLDGKYTFQSVKPYFYIAEDGTVSFSTQDYQEMIDKVFSYATDKGELQQTTFESLCGNNDIEKKALLFVTEGSGALEDNQRIELEQLEFEKIYTVADYRDEEVLFDKYGIYRKIFNIDWFPTIVWWEDMLLHNIAVEDLH